MKKPIPFGKYYLLERISVGGMAEVFKAKTFGVEGFERLIAVKRILPSIAEDEDFITMFIDEAKIAVQLQHANIAQIFDLGKVGDSYFIALEYVSGKDLRTIYDRMRKNGQSVPIPMTVYVTMKLCEGLDYAHNKKDAAGQDLNLVHRDVSPQNILVSYDGEVKVIDFGIAKAAGKAGKTQAGILKGKFGYMSPEQVRGLPLDRRSDIFSVGICLWEMATGERLFISDSDFSTLEKVRNVEISAPSQYNKRIPGELEQIILKALNKEVEDRYQTAMDLHDDLQRWMYTSGSFFARKDLGFFMHEVFRLEIDKETTDVDVSAVLGRSTVPPPARTPAPKPSPGRVTAPPPPPRIGQTPPTPTLQDRSKQQETPPPPPDLPFEVRTTRPAPPGHPSPQPKIQKRTMLGMPTPRMSVPPPPPPRAVAKQPEQQVEPPAPIFQGTQPKADLKEQATQSQITQADASIEMDDWDEDEPPTSLYSKETAADMAKAAVASAPRREVIAAPTTSPKPISAPPTKRPTAQHDLDIDEPIIRKRSLAPVFAGLGVAVVVLAIVFSVFFIMGKSSGTLKLEVEPNDNLKVVVDGVTVLPGNRSPFLISKLEKGEHGISIHRSGYKEEQLRINITGSDTIEQRVALNKEATGFFLETEPPGASVIVNGRPIDEKTPVTVTDLEPGTYMVRVTKGDTFAPANIEVDVKAGEVVELPKKILDLKSVEVTFATSPEGATATLFNDDMNEVLGETPVNKVLDREKQYKIKFTKDGYSEVVKLIEYEPGLDKMTINETLLSKQKPPRVAGNKQPVIKPEQPSTPSQGGKTGFLSVQTKPWSKVYINGKFIKNTPLVNHELKPGSYQVTVENPQFNIKKTFRATIRSGQKTSLVKTIID